MIIRYDIIRKLRGSAVLVTLLLIMTLFGVSTVLAQNSTKQPIKQETIIGKWSGNIILNETRSAGIRWRFEPSYEGSIIGYMGPASKGVATLPMVDLKIDSACTVYF